MSHPSPRHRRRRAPTAAALAIAVALALVTVGCSSGSAHKSGGSDTGPSSGSRRSTSAPGATDPVAPGDNRGRKSGNPQGFTVGLLLPKTGELAQLGPPMIKGGQMAVRDINAAGGVNGKKVREATLDDGGNSRNDLAKSNAGVLINQTKVDVLVGPASADTTKDIVGTVVKSGTVECSPSDTSDDLTSYPDQGLYFRTSPPDRLQGVALAQTITGDKHTKVAVLSLNNDYGKSLLGDLERGLHHAKADVVVSVPINPSGSNFDADVAKALQAKPDALVILGYPDTGGAVLKALAAKGKNGLNLPIYVSDGLRSNALYQQVDPSHPTATTGIKGTAPSVAPQGGMPGFALALEAFAPDVVGPVYSAQSYDCLTIAALAAEKAKSNSPYDIAKGFSAVTAGGGEKCSSFAACRLLLAAGKDITYVGASGPLELNSFGEPSSGEYDVFQYQPDGSAKALKHLRVNG